MVAYLDTVQFIFFKIINTAQLNGVTDFAMRRHIEHNNV